MRRAMLGILCSLVLAAPAVAAHRPKVSLSDLTLLAQSDLSAETTLVFLATREIGFELDPKAIALLREQGVSEEVIRYLLERMDEHSDPGDRVVYVSEGPYPPYYYALYYGHDVGLYLGFAILGHWTHGFHFIDGHHHGSSGKHSAHHGGRHHASGGHPAGGQNAGGHSSGGDGARNHGGSHDTSHARVDHSGGDHSGVRHRGRGHGGGHSAVQHRGRGHGGGHSAVQHRGRGHGGGHSAVQHRGRGHGGGHGSGRRR